MATDRNGKTIAVGDRYTLAGIVRHIDGDNVVLEHQGELVHARGSDLLQVSGFDGSVTTFVGVNIGTGRTAVDLYMDNRIVHATTSTPYVAPWKCTLRRVIGVAAHLSGGSISSWTLRFRRYDSSITLQETVNVTVPMTVASGYNLFDLAVDLSFASGEVLDLYFSGPSATTPQVRGTLLWRIDQ